MDLPYENLPYGLVAFEMNWLAIKNGSQREKSLYFPDFKFYLNVRCYVLYCNILRHMQKMKLESSLTSSLGIQILHESNDYQ